MVCAWESLVAFSSIIGMLIGKTRLAFRNQLCGCSFNDHNIKLMPDEVIEPELGPNGFMSPRRLSASDAPDAKLFARGVS